MSDMKKYSLKVSSTRTNQALYDFRKDFADAIAEGAEGKDYVMDVEIKITAEAAGGEAENVAYFRSVLYDEEKLAELGLDLEQAARESELDINDHAYWMMENDMYKSEASCKSPWSGYILTWYIYPDYRNEGIATFIFENLAKLLKRSLGINLRCTTIYPHPQSEGTWENIFDPDMLVLMTDTVEDHGFVAAGKEGYYIKNYDA